MPLELRKLFGKKLCPERSDNPGWQTKKSESSTLVQSKEQLPPRGIRSSISVWQLHLESEDAGSFRKDLPGCCTDEWRHIREKWRNAFIEKFRFAHTPSPPFLPEDFQLKRALGAGTFGTVYLAHYRVTQRWIALKVLAKRRLVEKNQVQHAMNEKKLMSACEHPFIAALLLHRKDTTYVYLGIELYNGGELFQAARDDGPWPDDVVSFYAAEILLALEYLHGVDILYRDLKTENVILDWKGHVRLTDFGFAKRISVRTYTVCGTLEYMAPEILAHNGYHRSADFWAFGVLIYELLRGTSPFHSRTDPETYRKIMNSTEHLVFPAHFFSPTARDLCKRLVEPDLSRRLGLTGYGLQDIKAHAFFDQVRWLPLLERRVRPPWRPRVDGPNDDALFLSGGGGATDDCSPLRVEEREQFPFEFSQF